MNGKQAEVSCRMEMRRIACSLFKDVENEQYSSTDKRNAKIYDIPLYLSSKASSREAGDFILDEFKSKEMRVTETRSFT